jgi:23S rRNA (uracil1939-C5)-methyltransferase
MVKEGRNEQFNVGFHKRGEFSRVEDYPTCTLIDENANVIYWKIRDFCKNTGYAAFDQKMVTGFFRHLVMRMTYHTKEIMLILSVHPKYFSTENEYTQALTILREFFMSLAQEHTDVASIYISHNENKADTSIGELELIYGKETISETILGLRFDISPKSFFQTNTLGAENLYSIARSFLSDRSTKRNIILDLYAGTGTLGMIFSPFWKKVYSVELVKDATEDGQKNAKHNGLEHIEFINAKVEDFLKDFKTSWQTPDVLIIDPPRAGMHPDALPSILSFNAEEIMYISCNPATLARDLEMILKDWKYSIDKVQAVDMFPHTHHIEVVTSLRRK